MALCIYHDMSQFTSPPPSPSPLPLPSNGAETRSLRGAGDEQISECTPSEIVCTPPPPPCGDTWVCQMTIALRDIASATACPAKKRSRLIMNRTDRSSAPSLPPQHTHMVTRMVTRDGGCYGASARAQHGYGWDKSRFSSWGVGWRGSFTQQRISKRRKKSIVPQSKTLRFL